MNVPTKIVKGMIEITSDVKLVTKDEKVSLSAQTLLAKMGIKPFEYGMLINHVYQDGAVFDAAVKWNHIVIWHAVFWLFSRNVQYLLNFSVPLSLVPLKTCQFTIWFHFKAGWVRAV